ncbi:potassium channel subfamily K member 13 [Erythrolamprus reginae]|uniref:potassium channel subfamily K member 13 n=1 Tax=Erythrolamprus reginae TaxID=121349 RepID=UPI00396C353E
MACGRFCCCCSPCFGTVTLESAQLMLLFVLTLLYMCFGAIIFSDIERYSELDALQKWQIKIENFSLKYNMALAELKNFLFEYEAAYVVGVRTNETRPMWDLVGAFYFVCTVVSTVGFGRTVPSTTTGKLFLILYGPFGCAASALFLNLFLERLITFVGHVIKTYHERRLKRKLARDGQQAGIVKIDELADWKPSVYHVLVLSGLVSVIVSCVASVMFSATEGWSYSDSLYYCFVTFSTIGFGDMVSGWNPNYTYQLLYRFVNGLVVLIGICFMYSLINVISIAIKQFLNWTLKNIGRTCHTCRRKPLKSQSNVMPGTVWKQRSISVESAGVLRRERPGEMSMEDLLPSVSLDAMEKQLDKIPYYTPPVENGFAGGVGALGVMNSMLAETSTDT